MNKNGAMSDFVREAIREKASRELLSLNQRADAFGGIEQARDALFTLTTQLSSTASAVGALAPDNTVSTKLRKLRKLVEDAHVLATELGDALGVEAQREALAASRQSILDALRAAGIEPNVVLMPSAGGDAQ